MIYEAEQSGGVRGTTSIWVRKSPTGRTDWPFKYEARMGVAVLGSYHKSLWTENPFDPNFRDNYAKGVGMTEEVALRKMKQEVEELLWAY